MRTGLALAWRALWWRRGLSAAVLAVSVVVVTVAVAGPTYDRAAKESVLQDSLRSAPPLETGFEVTSVGPVAGLRSVVSSALRDSHASLYGQPISAMEAPYTGPIRCSRTATDLLSPCVAQVTGLVVARDAVADHVTVTAGRLPRAAGEAVVSTTFLASAHLHVGDRITPQGSAINADVRRNSAYQYTPQVPVFTALRIVGTYSTDERAGFWFQRPYFAALASDGGDSVPYEDAIFTVPATLSDLAYKSVIDVPLDVPRVRVANASALDHAAQQIKRSPVGNVVATQLPSVLDQASANEKALDTPVLLIVLQLLLLCGLVLFGAVRAAADARGPEIALAKLRRFSPRSVLVFGLAEPLLLIPPALPLGLGLGWLTTRFLAHGQLLPGTPVVLSWQGVGAGALAVAAAGLATLGVGIRIATRPAGAQWRRADHRPASRPWWIDLVVFAAAAGGLVALMVTGGLGRTDNTSSASSVSLAAPALVALAIAMVGSRLLPWGCRRLYRRSERGGFAGFLAIRQIARRPTTLAVTVLLAVALALATFAVSAYTVAKANRHDVAATAVGAAEVAHVQTPPGSDLGTLVDQVDPSGRQAMAVTASPALAPDRRLLIGVQPSRLAAVATWRGDFAGASLADIARALTVPGLHPVTVTGSQLAVSATVSALAGAPVLRLSATVVADGSIYQLTGPPLPASGTVRSLLTLPACSQGCRLSGLGVSRDDSGTTDLRGDITVNSLQQKGSAGWTDVPGALRGGASDWRAVVPDAPGYSSTVSGADQLDFRFHLPYQQQPELTVHDLPAALPVATTEDVGAGAVFSAGGLDQQQLPVRAAVVAHYLPRAQADGLLVDRTLAIRSAVQVGQAQQEVWLAKGADPGILQRLQARGVVVGQTETTAATGAALSRQGPPLALALFRLGAVVAAILALGGTALTLALAARRRGFELAALIAQGVTRRSLFRSIAAEQGVLLGYGTLLGVGSGLLGAVVALPSVPEFVTAPVAPHLLYQPPYLLVVLIVLALGSLVVAGSLASSAALVRSVDPDRLREYAP